MSNEMRTVYHEKLSELSDHLGKMCGMAGAAMDHATQALLGADLAAAEQVITDHQGLVSMRSCTYIPVAREGLQDPASEMINIGSYEDNWSRRVDVVAFRYRDLG